MKSRKALWKGAISFGLVNIPVHMYTATEEHEISFTLLHKKDHSEIRYARFCKAEDKEVPWNEIVKGYEFESGNFVILEDADFEKANPKKTKTIEIVSFIEEDEIDSMYYVKPYFLEPEKNSGNAYNLLREALKKSKKVGLAKYILRNKEHLAVIKFHKNALVLNQLRYGNELQSAQDLAIPASKPSSKEIDIAIQLIDHLTTPFQPELYKDSYTEEIKQMIKKKSKGRPIQPKKEERVKSPKIHDMMTLLKASLNEKPESKKKSRKTA